MNDLNTANDSASRPHIILIHGAWQGSWAFSAWTPWLENAGWQVHAVDLPGNGHSRDHARAATLPGYTDHVVELLASLDAPAVVLGHSGGGMTASQVAEAMPERVRALVYLAGMMVPDGWGFADVIARCQQDNPGFDYQGVGQHLIWNETRTASHVPVDAAMALFLQDCEESAARDAAMRLAAQPESGRSMHNQLTPERYGRVPRIYVECTEDRSVSLPLQRCMQRLTPGADCISLACGHVPQLVRPELLTARLLPLLDALPMSNNPSAAMH
ncbi:alpha/beta hydrolase [Diaphorobacter sp. HDW4A]|uniref:alpha/beta fold hydrolase n=1 Tax=Diaphorobacter sp. HDW4A TaxID=2714924 RepID=UPI0014080053|nr:alpha/beta fold hydrolase [Diaphorobacter sp. HDW4A]QIL79928.1 alpha/beta hydrolase [Diaphorobacter sp. HDW4A]